MRIIIGLGNPGTKFQNNRHNVGFMFIDFIAPLFHCSIVTNRKPYLTMKQSDNGTIILVKPQLFMNQSGIAVKKFLSLHTPYSILNTKSMFVVHDDLDLKLGSFKIQFGKGPKLHNGIESVEQTLRTNDFWRIR